MKKYLKKFSIGNIELVGIELVIVPLTIFVELSNITGSEPPLTPFFEKRWWAANAVQDLSILSEISLNQTTQKMYVGPHLFGGNINSYWKTLIVILWLPLQLAHRQE